MRARVNAGLAVALLVIPVSARPCSARAGTARAGGLLAGLTCVYAAGILPTAAAVRLALAAVRTRSRPAAGTAFAHGEDAAGALNAYRRGMAAWWSIEVFHSEFPAGQWRDSYSSTLTESAVTAGATSWEWHEHRWGVVFEVEFGEDSWWDVFRAIPAVQAALDAVPDPVNGLLVYRGRGGGAGASSPRRPRPTAGAAAVALPEPGEQERVDLTAATPPGLLDPAGLTPR